MKLSRISLLLLLLIVTNQVASAQSLPAKVKSYLDKTYVGWKQSVASVSDCNADFREQIIVGDFDGNGKQDYAVRITHKRKGYFMAFLEQKTGYKAHILLSLSATQIKYYGMYIAKKGDKYSIGDPYEDNAKTGRLPNDAPVIGDCGSHAYPYIYRKGRFSLE